MLARKKYIEDIKNEIAIFQNVIKLSQPLNQFNDNIYGEDHSKDMLNIIFDDVDFINANSKERNIKGIDLICNESKRCIQVTSSITTTKVKNSYKRFMELDEYEQGYSLEFFYLLEKPEFDKIKEPNVENLQNTFFNFEDLIIDINKLNVDKLEKLTKLFIKNKKEKPDNPKVINPPTYKDLDKVYGRQGDLEKLDMLLKSNDRLALINGLGGVGKTTLATSYFMEKSSFYDSRYWLEYEDSLENSFFKLYSHLFDGDMKGLEKEAALSKILDHINNTKGQNLLVVDNLSDSDDIKLITGLSPNWKVLITSRKEFEQIENLELDILDEKAAKELFINTYKLKEYDEKTLDKILKKCGGHALTIELIAKISLKNSKRRTLEDVLESLDNQQFDLSSINFRKKDADQNLANQLMDTFKEDISELDTEEKIILQNLSILATLEFKDKEFLKDMQIEEEQKDRYYDALANLSEYGLIKYEDDRISIHQVISDVSRRVLGLDFEVCKSLIESFNLKIKHDPHKSFLDYVLYIADNESILKSFGDKKEESLSFIYGNLSIIYRYMGELEEALKYQKKNIEICGSIYENKNHPNLATAYGNLSGIYQDMGELEEALKYQKKDIKICEIIHENKNHPNLATAYGNLSGIYRHMGELEEALKYQKKNIEIKESIYEKKNHPNLATAYGNLSTIYRYMKELEEALKYQKKNIEICESIYENKNHPNLAIAYGNLSEIYRYMGKLNEALKYNKKNIGICEYIYENKNHPNLATAYSNLALVYYVMKEFEESLKYHKKGIEIKEKIYENRNHSELMLSYLNISVLYLTMKDYQNGVTYLKRAYAIYIYNFPNGHPVYDVVKEIKEQVLDK